jgi:regulator of sigma E protease
VPKPLTELAISEEQRKQNDRMQDQNKKAIDAIEDQGQRELALKQYELGQKKVFLGIQLVDRKVIYNPTPIEQFSNVLSQTWLTLKSLFTGNLSPKHLSGPVGIVQAVHYGWMKGAKEALFWMGFVSLNLGIVNLLPVPVFDGGHIMFALFEKITKRRLSANTMEWLVIPFVGLLIAFFIYITYQDIVRIFSGFF